MDRAGVAETLNLSTDGQLCSDLLVAMKSSFIQRDVASSLRESKLLCHRDVPRNLYGPFPSPAMT